jgi:hypothetical protein
MRQESEAANKESGSEISESERIEMMGGVDEKVDFEQEYEDRPETLLKYFKSSLKM